MPRPPLSVGTFVALLIAATCSLAVAVDDNPDPPVLLEQRDDPWLPWVAGHGGGFGVAGLDSGAAVQVNVDAFGLNIPGDAANEPSIAVDPTAPLRMAIGWRQFDTILSNFRQAGYSWTVDGGRTWAAGSVIEPGLFRSDPVLGAAPDGTFYYLSLQINAMNQFLCDFFQSADGGQTWPVKNAAFGGDKSWFAIDTTGGPGDGHVYQGWNVAGNEFFPALFNRAVDGGITWETPVEYDPSGIPPARPVFGILDVGPDGSVYVAGARNSSNSDQFWVVRSFNAENSGVTPTFPQIVEVDMGGNLRISVGPNPQGLLGQVNIAVDRSGGPNDGNVYVLGSVDPPGGDPMDVHFIRSLDGGLTWSAPVRVHAGTFGYQWFGTMSVAPNGRIDVVFNDTGVDAGGNLSALRYTHSNDGGVTWEPVEVLTGSFNHTLGWPQQNKLGDYYDMISDNVGASLAWAATFNGEQDVYYIRIGDEDCNRNGVGDAEELTGADCNANGILDSCEIAAGTAADDNGDGIPDECPTCPWDFNVDGAVGIVDLLTLLGAWGPNPGHRADLDGSGSVGIEDLLVLLANWGPCPVP